MIVNKVNNTVCLVVEVRTLKRIGYALGICSDGALVATFFVAALSVVGANEVYHKVRYGYHKYRRTVRDIFGVAK